MEVARAIVEAFAEGGPNVSLFNASPAASFVFDGRTFHAARGWWVVFATDLVVSLRPERGHHAIEMTFTPPGRGVHGGESWTWLLNIEHQAYGRRLVLQDHAHYPLPVINLLSYQAIGSCRDALVRRITRILEHEGFLDHDRSWTAAVSNAVLAPALQIGALLSSLLPAEPAQEDLPGWPSVSGQSAKHWQDGRAGRGKGGVAGDQSLRMWRPDTDRGTDPQPLRPIQREWQPSQDSLSQSIIGQLPTAITGYGAREVPVDAAASTAERLGEMVNVSEGFGVSHSSSRRQPIPVRGSLGFEDKLDVLRSNLPRHSSDTLRRMLNNNAGDLNKTLGEEGEMAGW